MSSHSVFLGFSCYKTLDFLYNVLWIFLFSDHNRRIAFTATLKLDVKVKANEVFKFDKVVVNEGNHFNLKTGIFTAPINGLYHISCTIEVSAAGNAYYRLMKNNENDFYVGGYIVNTAKASQSQSIVMDLQKGDRVFLMGRSTFSLQNTYTYFSGYLL